MSFDPSSNFNTKLLCNIAKVSLSWFYKHKKKVILKQTKDPYSKIRKATQEHNTAKNILNREFKWLEPFKKIWTDISYLCGSVWEIFRILAHIFLY